MRVDSVDFFYVAMSEIADRGDGSQDALLVRVRSAGLSGWGECEAAPLPSIAAWCCPPSHSACRPVRDSVLGARLESPEDIERIGREVRRRSFDLLQAPHTLSGVEIALWDLLGKRHGLPVWRLLGHERAFPKRPYASALFGDTPAATLDKARALRAAGYSAVKLGWGPFGSGALADDETQLDAARQGLGPGVDLLVDAGTVFGEDVDAAAQRLPSLEAFGALWFEEPFGAQAFDAYAALAARSPRVALAGGEGSHSERMARNLIDFGHVGWIQIDTGRIGGLAPAARVARYAAARGVRFVNHTFTTQLALSASLQPYAGLEEHDLCEVPVEPTPLGRDLFPALERDDGGRVVIPDAPGLGVEPDLDVLRRYLIDVDVRVGGTCVYRTPEP